MKRQGPAALIFLAAAAGFAQIPSPQKFDVVSIRPNQSGSVSRRAGAAPGGRFTATNVSLRLLISRAFGVSDFQVVRGPGWLDTDNYDIEARADTTAEMSREQLQPCLQNMLAERFQLKTHRESKEGSVYSLVAAKNGPKLTEHVGAGSPAVSLSTGSGKAAIVATNVTMTRLTDYLAPQIDRPIIDNTGLKGAYDFRLEWVLDLTAEPSGPSVFTALREQLGLRLESARGPIANIVVDGVERPSGN